jgi:hypothetical protein
VQNGFEGESTEVKIHVVRVTLAGSEYVPINANNDNGSSVTHEIPTYRDFDIEYMSQYGEPFADEDLIEANVTINPNANLPGYFVVSVTNNGVGEIRLWHNRYKDTPTGYSSPRAEGVFTLENLPRTFYLEGVEPSATVGESVIRVRYVFIRSNGEPTTAGLGLLDATVTPVIEEFKIVPGGVRFENLQNGLMGMRTGIENVQPGAAFEATVTRTGIDGFLTFIQNVTGIDNGVNGAPAG